MFTLRENEKMAVLQKEQESAYNSACLELERKRQSYLFEIAGLKSKLEYRDFLIGKLSKELQRTRKNGIAKLREQGNEGGAKRAEKKLAKLMDAVASVPLPSDFSDSSG